MDATGSTNSNQEMGLVGSYAQAALTQTDTNFFHLPVNLMGKIFQYVLSADPATQVRSVCKAMDAAYTDLTNLESVLKRKDFETLKLIVSVTSAPQTQESEDKLLELVEKIAFHAIKSEDTQNLRQILELPQFSAQKYQNLKQVFRNPPEFHSGGIISWACKEGGIKLVELIALNFPKKVFQWGYLEMASKSGQLEIAKMLVANTPAKNDKMSNALMNQVIENGHTEVAELLEKFSIGDINTAIKDQIYLISVGSPEIAVKVLNYAFERKGNSGKTIIDLQISNILNEAVRRNNSIVANLVFNYLMKTKDHIDVIQIFEDLTTSVRTPATKDTNFSFAYNFLEFIQNKEYNFTERDIGELVGIIFRKEIARGELQRAKRLLSHPLMNPSVHGNIAANMVLCEIENAIRVFDTQKKDKLIDLLLLMLNHPNFDPDAPVKQTPLAFDIWRSAARSPEIIELLNNHPKLTRFATLKRNVSKKINENRGKVGLAAGALIAWTYPAAVQAVFGAVMSQLNHQSQ